MSLFSSKNSARLTLSSFVSPYTVAKEMGHGGRALVDRVYGHLGEIRHRSETVEYRMEHHMAVEGYEDRVRALRGKAAKPLA